MILHSATKRRRQGYINIIEILIVLPLFLALFLAIVYFSSILTVQTLLNNAAHLAARAVACGGSEEDARAALKHALGEQRARHAELRIAPAFSEDKPILPGQPVEVVVRIRTQKVVPNWLGFIGLNLGNRFLVGREVMRME